MQEKLDEFYIHPNMMQSGRIMGFRKRSIIEAIVVGFLVKVSADFINSVFIHFVPRVHNIVTIGLIIGFGGLALYGIKGMCLSELFINLFIMKKTAHKYRFRTIDRSRRSVKDAEIIATKTKINQSYGERFIKFIKKKVKGIKEAGK